MIDFPESTKTNRRIPKEAFYKHLSLSTALKSKFVSDISRIVAENSLTKENLNLVKDSEIKEILLLSIELKKQDYDQRIIEAIAKGNPHKLVFLMSYEDQRQLAVYYQKLYLTEWMSEAKVEMHLSGDSLEEIWSGLVRQIAIGPDVQRNSNLSLDDQLNRLDEMQQLQQQIKKLEKAAWGETQPKKKFALYQDLKKNKEQLEVLKRG
ncbi:DUF4391 domain-containing protein [Lactobacillus delbrueckii subsp. lactis]|uniref:DUF4391 domain-containing protein n=1 Tax=Lactobacillus delbrueckii TaxID=1584 RepID=UPI001108E01F|nr:DUF4391 domain-containing protein [Lactobacillus delbrueckii]MBD5835675.1 DUF4391 domain-containing protein [Lactobacillus delbrueckii]MBO1168484.1 DUF4391 domain-containing protein [Lactobacillus delbrueckii subsp. lactis]MBO1170244.1 DUF4391 domain-containing protein [Lactobacillus delbrueckii subsp. lactis]MBO1172012.1 DUF4391 domain-containing protein [Lactobacillus delbrueckii subsp. lactis]MBO1175385.1 DUF4391 domain-containing protein [Lactobacillus delbrueckii subsp. lactis]